MQKTTLSLTAYKCRICEKRKNEDLLMLEEEIETKVDLKKLLFDYSDFIKNSQVGKNSNRTIRLDKDIQRKDIGQITKYSIFTKTGKLGEDFDVYNHEDHTNTFYNGLNNAAMYYQRTYCFINNKTGENVFIFFRFGLGGCKTAFQETLNQYLSLKKMIAHFDIMLSPVMFEQNKGSKLEKLTLVTQYMLQSSDAAENIMKCKKQTSKEVVLYLDSPAANNVREWLKNLVDKKPSLEELKQITILDNLGNDFDDAFVTLKFGKATRKIKLQDFAGRISEYDITDKVEYYDDGSKFKEDSLDKIVEEYAMSFFDVEE